LILIGLDPGLGCTGWGVIAAEGNRLSHVANGQIRTDAKLELPKRLVDLHDRLVEVLARHRPEGAAVEEVFVNDNPQSTLKLGQARGVVLLAAARTGVHVGEYAARLVKKAVVGTGGAEKSQVHAMIGRLLPGVKIVGADAADALAVAITHAHHLATRRRGGLNSLSYNFLFCLCPRCEHARPSPISSWPGCSPRRFVFIQTGRTVTFVTFAGR
jgi:crossover junction endodeoxyribonuclease RuvC